MVKLMSIVSPQSFLLHLTLPSSPSLCPASGPQAAPNLLSITADPFAFSGTLSQYHHTALALLTLSTIAFKFEILFLSLYLTPAS